MAGNKPLLPRPPFDEKSYQGQLSRGIEREVQKLGSDVRKLVDGRLAGVLALDAPPGGGTWAPGDVVRNSAPTLTITASTTFVLWGWERVDEGAGTLTWAELRFWQSMAGGSAGSFAATSQTATSTGTGVATYVGNAAGELTFRKLQAGTGISITTSGGAAKITNTVAAGGFSGASQTATSTGSGVSLYVGNNGNELTFRKAQAGSGISLTTSGGALRITATGGASFTGASQTATHTGTGVSLYVGNSAGELTFRKAQAGSGISLTTSGGALRITATGAGGGNSITTTAAASRPAATTRGTLFLPNNSIGLEVANGTTWDRWGPLYPLIGDVPSSGWSKIGTVSSSYSVVDLNGILRLYSPSGPAASAANWMHHERNRTSLSAGHLVTACFDIGMFQPHVGGFFGIYLGDSAALKTTNFVLSVASAPTFAMSTRPAGSITAGLTLGITLTAVGGLTFPSPFVWLQIESDAAASRRKFKYSTDGQNFIECYSLSYTNSTSALTMDKVGVVFCSSNSTVALNREVKLMSWQEK